MNLSAVRIFVRNLPEAEKFYASILGLPLAAGGAEYGYCVFKPGHVQLVVEHVSLDAPDDEQALVGRFTGLSFSVASAQAKYTELLRLGVTFTGAPEQQAWGGILATLLDPAGNELQLVQAPAEA